MRPPTVSPIRANSPVAWTAVVTSSPPVGCPIGRGGGGADFGRLSSGHPALTAAGLLAGAGVVRAAFARRGAAALARAGFGFVTVATGTSRRALPKRWGRVAERLPSTLSASFAGLPVEVVRLSAMERSV
jgi:hypothetical protein